MNRIFKTTIFSLMALTVLSSCNDWLDVSPKSQIKEEDHFSREGGYKDQLTGVYTAMSSTSMYGLNMGIGFTEVLSQNYDIDGSGTWRYANDYDYANSGVETTIATIWKSTYSAISNLNIMIRNIDKADPKMFTDNNYYLYKGEAYGLRGFLYLDLMRLFACAPAMDDNSKGVPYVTEYSTNVVEQKTVGETMKLVINDLLTAREALEHDSLKCSPDNQYDHRASRIPYFNYYAATLTLARAYLWMGDKENALRYANEIVEENEEEKLSSPFRFVDNTVMQSSKLNEIDMTFSTEHIFHLTIKDWEDTADKYFTSKAGSSALTPSETKAQDIYELGKGYGNDWRYLKGYEQDGTQRFMCKFWHVEGSAYNDIYPLLRLTEAYYIAAECLKESNPERAVELLNKVREARNLSLFPLDYTMMTADDIQNEIYKEYRKEFVGEGGQLFYYYKRINASEIKGAVVRPGKSVYVLPVPSNDQEFGGYEN